MPNSTINANTNGLNSTAGNVSTLDLQVAGSTVASVTSTGMAVTGTLSSTGVSSFPAGSNTAPSITFTGDTNTGIYSPAADTIAFTEGGVEAARLDSSGNLLVGTTTAVQKLTVNGYASVNGNNISADNSLGFRNRIINGDMRIAQRGTAAVTATDGFPVDRFKYQLSGSGTISSEQSTDAPNGFINSLKFTVTTADSSISSTEFYQFAQFIEGSNISDVGLGQSWCKTLVLSFWVKASQTGTYSVQLAADGGNTCYPTTVTVNSANTWEYKTISIAAITSGTFLTTTGVGLAIRFGFAYGSNFTGATTSTWGTFSGFTNSFVAPTNNMLATLNSTFYITGVQLEVGSVATPFERRPYGMELALCQRYYQSMSNFAIAGYASGASESIFGSYQFKVTMRAAPTVTVTNNGSTSRLTSFNVNATSVDSVGFQVVASGAGFSGVYGTTAANAAIEL